MAADPHKYPYIFGWAFKEVRGNWIHILRQQVRENRDASDTALRDMALAMFMPPVLQDYHQDCTQSGVRAGGEAAVSTISLQVVSYTATGGVVVLPYGVLTTQEYIPPMTCFGGYAAPMSFSANAARLDNVFCVGSRNTNLVQVSPSGKAFTAITIAATGACYTAVCATASKFIAVAQGHTDVRWSPNGQAWFAGTAMPSANNWLLAAALGDVVVVIPGTGSTVAAYSSNGGVTWGTSTVVDRSWSQLVAGNGIFVACTDSILNNYMTSPDGVTWTARTFTRTIDHLYLANGRFFACDRANATTAVLTSTNGTTWTTVTMPISAQWFGVFYVNGKYYACESTNYFQYESTTGTSGWTKCPVESTTLLSAEIGTIISRDDNRLSIAFGSGTAAYNTYHDGDAYYIPARGRVLGDYVWSAPLQMLFTGNAFVSVGNGAWQLSYDSKFAFSSALPNGTVGGYVLGTNGTIVAAINQQTYEVFTSPVDGRAFTQRSNAPTPPAGTYYGTMAWGNGIFVCQAGYSPSFGSTPTNKYITSPDGITWTQRTMPSTHDWGGICFDGTKFVCLSHDGYWATSTNGTSWTTGTCTAGCGYAIAYGNGVFVALSDVTRDVLTSADGQDWSSHVNALPFTVGGAGGIAFGGGLFLVTSTGNSDSFVLLSADGVAWTQYAKPDSNYALNPVYNSVGGYFMAQQSGSVVTFRLDGLSIAVAAGGAVAGGAAAYSTGQLQSVSVSAVGGAIAYPVSLWSGGKVSIVAGGAVSAPVSVVLSASTQLPTGGAVAGGAAGEGLYVLSTGGAVAGASAPEGFYQITFGGAVAGGAALEGLAQIVAGGAVAGGAADASIQTSSQIYSQDGVGLAVAAVTSSLHVTVVPVVSGGAVAAVTSAPLVMAVKIGLITAVAGGAVSEYVKVVSEVSSGAVAGGTAPFSSNTLANEYSYTAAGGSVAGGIAENIQYAFPVAIAGAVASGGYSAQATTVIPVAGGAVAGADAAVLQSAVMSAVGGAVTLPAGSTSIGWVGDKTAQAVAGGAAGIVASIALYGSVAAVASGGVTVRATAYADSYGGAVGGGAAPFIGYGVLSLVVTASAVAGGAGAVSSMAFSPSIQILWSVEDYQPRFMGSSADNRFYGVDTQIRFTGE